MADGLRYPPIRLSVGSLRLYSHPSRTMCHTFILVLQLRENDRQYRSTEVSRDECTQTGLLVQMYSTIVRTIVLAWIGSVVLRTHRRVERPHFPVCPKKDNPSPRMRGTSKIPFQISFLHPHPSHRPSSRPLSTADLVFVWNYDERWSTLYFAEDTTAASAAKL